MTDYRRLYKSYYSKIVENDNSKIEDKHNVDNYFRVNKKEKRLAIRSLLSSKVLENNLVVVDKFELKEIKTKTMATAMKNLKVEGKALIVLPANNEMVQKSARNLADVRTSSVSTINVYDLLKYNKLVVTVDTIKKLEEVYA